MKTKRWRPGIFGPLLLSFLTFFVVGCQSRIPTATQNLASCQGPYTWAYGAVSDEFINRVQQVMQAGGLDGSVQAGTFGENNGNCGYGAMAVDYVFTVRVQDLETAAGLAEIGVQVQQIALRFVDESPAPNLGNLSLVFRSGDRQCNWTWGEGAWNADEPSDPGEVLCPVPVSPESQRLADALNALSEDLTCETSTIETNNRQSVLECERPEGQNHYLVTVTMQLNGQGYDETCFHGYQAFGSSVTGDTPMTVTDSSGSYFERDRSFEWTADGIFYELFERIKGGQDVTYPGDTREKVYQRAVQAGLIPGEGNDCP
jgi:hypothetical protein